MTFTNWSAHNAAHRAVQQRRVQAEIARLVADDARCPCGDIHAYEDECVDFMKADREYERSQDR